MAHILVIDDESCIREPLCDLLTRLGHRCTEAVDGREAAELLTQQDVDIIVSDVMMPRLSGFQLLQAIAPHIDGRIPFLFLSSIENADGVENAIYAGADDYLFKPCEPAKVEAVLARAVAQREENLRRLGPYGAKGPAVPASVLDALPRPGASGSMPEAVPLSGQPALKKAPTVLRVAGHKPDGGAGAPAPTRGVLGRLFRRKRA